MTADDLPSAILFLVEDDDLTREELARILSKHREFTVRSFGLPSKALEAAADGPPDMALLDLRLPEMDGLSLLDRLQSFAPDLLAIIMTGYGDAATPRMARERGAVDFVEKPLDLPYLLVSLRQQAREAHLRKSLRHSAELFAKLTELLRDGIVMTDSEGKVLFANSLGKELKAGGLKEDGERTVHEGRVFALQTFASGDRVLLHWVDITQALDMERLEGYREMSRLLAHEVRNPLTPMRLWLQELLAADPAEPQYAQAVKEAQRVLLQQVERLSALVDRFKTLGHDARLALRPVDCYAALREVSSALELSAAQAGVSIQWAREASPVWVLADEDALYQLLFNLVKNALEAYGERAGTVRIGVEAASSDEVHLAVEDEAGGLQPEVAGSPFTPYLTTKRDGTGLGLLVCRELVRRMGGDLTLTNREGIGVTARIVLRAAPGPSAVS